MPNAAATAADGAVVRVHSSAQAWPNAFVLGACATRHNKKICAVLAVVKRNRFLRQLKHFGANIMVFAMFLASINFIGIHHLGVSKK